MVPSYDEKAKQFTTFELTMQYSNLNLGLFQMFGVRTPSLLSQDGGFVYRPGRKGFAGGRVDFSLVFIRFEMVLMSFYTVLPRKT